MEKGGAAPGTARAPSSLPTAPEKGGATRKGRQHGGHHRLEEPSEKAEFIKKKKASFASWCTKIMALKIPSNHFDDLCYYQALFTRKALLENRFYPNLI